MDKEETELVGPYEWVHRCFLYVEVFVWKASFVGPSVAAINIFDRYRWLRIWIGSWSLSTAERQQSEWLSHVWLEGLNGQSGGTKLLESKKRALTWYELSSHYAHTFRRHQFKVRSDLNAVKWILTWNDPNGMLLRRRPCFDELN